MRKQERVRTTVANDSTAGKSKNPRERRKRSKPMGDDNERGFTKFVPNVVENELLRAGIKARGCLVEDQNPRLLQKCPCYGKPLTLATGELGAAGPNSLRETVGQRRDQS